MRLFGGLPFGINPIDVVVALTALSAFLVVIAVWRALLLRDPMGPRLKALARRRQGMREEMLATRRRPGELRAEHVHQMRSLVDRFNLTRGKATDKASIKLEQAGYRSPDAVVAYMFCKVVLPFLAVIGVLLVFYVIGAYNLSPMGRALWSVGLVAFAAFGPDIFIRNKTDKRRKALQLGVPDALDLMVICAEAGLSLDASLNRVSREIGPAHPELADELALTSIELGFLPERHKAMENLGRRTGLSSIRGLVNTLQQTERYGTPLSNSLRVLSAEFRNERMMRAETKAARLPAILTIPMIIFILPALFVVLLGPAVLITIDGMSGATAPKIRPPARLMPRPRAQLDSCCGTVGSSQGSLRNAAEVSFVGLPGELSLLPVPVPGSVPAASLGDLGSTVEGSTIGSPNAAGARVTADHAG